MLKHWQDNGQFSRVRYPAHEFETEGVSDLLTKNKQTRIPILERGAFQNEEHAFECSPFRSTTGLNQCFS
jgi:hypothetical protein